MTAPTPNEILLNKWKFIGQDITFLSAFLYSI